MKFLRKPVPLWSHFAVFGLLVVVLGALFAGVALGWKQLLTITIPVGDYQALLVPVFVLVLSSAILGVRLGTRERGGSWALIGPVALAATGILFGAEPPPQAVPLTLTLLACCLAWLVGRRMLRRRAARGNPLPRTVVLTPPPAPPVPAWPAPAWPAPAAPDGYAATSSASRIV